TNYDFNENTVIVTHSLGGVVALKLLPQLKTTVSKVVFVAPPLRNEFVDSKKRPELDKATDWEFDFKEVKENATELIVIADTNDPKLPQSHAQELAQNLDAQLIKTTAEFPHFNGKTTMIVLKELLPHIDVFTTRPDTVFGATFMVIAPEHPIVKSLISLELNADPEQAGKVKTYVNQALKKSENERIADGKDKTGVFTGLHVLNPATGDHVPVWVADYVVGSYGTGAVMSVPAHDLRDWEFAQKYNLPIKHVVMPSFVDTGNPPQQGKENTQRTVIIAIVRDPKTDKYLTLRWKKQDWKTFITGGVEGEEDIAEAAKREVAEETGYTDLKLVRELGGPTEAFFYAAHKGVNRQTKAHIFLFELTGDTVKEVASDERDQHEAVWMTGGEIVQAQLRHGEFAIVWERIQTGNDAYTGAGVMINSGPWDGWHSHKDADKIVQYISDKGWGVSQEQYDLRDWLISRQRYWGPPIPMIFCESCAQNGKPKTSSGWYPVPDADLPVVLPDIQDFKPTGGGVSPLANHPEFYETPCPECGGRATRETDVSDTFLDSAWYFFRYISTENNEEPFHPNRAKKWLPVDIYIGGAEHSVLHLLYARFVTMVLHDLGYCDFEEPFKKFYAHGLLIKEGAKMSKSKGNVIVPDEYITKYGADTLRSYLMFLGPFDQGGDFYDSGIEGMFRFLRRIWVLLDTRTTIGKEHEDITRARHKTIYGVTKDLEEFGYNTALSKLMELYNLITKGKSEFEKVVLSQDTVEAIIKMLAPFAPHMTEELYQHLHSGNSNFESVHLSRWPEYEEKYLHDDTVVIVVQVNGKRRAELSVQADEVTDTEAIEIRARKTALKYLTSEVKKIIHVPGKIVNFVV
ncbi:MAG TPA: class I tRNA ligase family protein, partial [Candidatus Levybacteria bacterium]|nr:class I tRNA ligase family protein [Candidatus Levybacteria bacterium]